MPLAPTTTPIAMTAGRSFSRPRSSVPMIPYLAPPSHWELYRDDEIDDPRVGDMPQEARDAHDRRLFYTTGRHMDEIGPEDVRRAPGPTTRS